MVFPALCDPSAGRRRNHAVRPQLVQPGRGRAGDGLLQRRRRRGILSVGAGVRADAGAFRHHPHQILVLDHRRRTAFPVPDAHRRPHQTMEAQSHGLGIAPPLGSNTPGPRRRCWNAPIFPRRPWWVVEAVDKKRSRLNCIHHLLTQIPYGEVEHAPVILPDRVHNPDYVRNPLPKELFVPQIY